MIPDVWVPALRSPGDVPCQGSCLRVSSRSPSQLNEGKLQSCPPAHPIRVSVEKLSLISCSSTRTEATHRNSNQRASGLSFHLLRC